MSNEIEIHKGVTTEKISAIFRNILKRSNNCRKARDMAKDPMKALMLAGKTKAYVEVLCLIHDRYPHHLEAGLWTGRKE